MKGLDLINRMKKMDKLITQKETGTPKEFAQEIGVSESRLYDLLVMMKKIGVPVQYSRIQKTYLYMKKGEFIINAEWRYRKNKFVNQQSFASKE